MTYLNLYLVANGEVSAAEPETETDGINSTLVAARDEADALQIAAMVDAGELQIDNLAGPACGYPSEITIACAARPKV